MIIHSFTHSSTLKTWREGEVANEEKKELGGKNGGD
jgi:hypothetical protein